MKVLILSCNTGEGHNSASKALHEQFLRRDVECDIYDALSFASKTFSKTVCKSYSSIVLNAPKLNGAGYRFVRASTGTTVRSLPYQINTVYTKKLYRFIVEEGYDVLIMPHLFSGEAVSHIKRKYALELPRYILSTDYSFCPGFDELDATDYLIPSELLVQDFLDWGIPAEKIKPFGIPVAARFVNPVSRAEARKELHLPEDTPLYLFMTGSMGFGDTGDLVEALLKKVSADARIIVLGGNNEKLKNGLRERFSPDRVYIYDFTDKVHIFMSACDVLFTKPGGLSTTEAMNINIPVVLSGAIPGCETENMEYFLKNGLCLAGETMDEIAQNAIDLVEKPEVREKMLRARDQYLCHHSAERIVDFIIRENKSAKA